MRFTAGVNAQKKRKKERKKEREEKKRHRNKNSNNKNSADWYIQLKKHFQPGVCP